MITKEEKQELLYSTEAYRVERTTSTGDMDKFQKTIGSQRLIHDFILTRYIGLLQTIKFFVK